MKDQIGDGLKSMFDYIFGGNIFDGLESVLTADFRAEGELFSSVWTIIVNIYNSIIVPIALCLMIIWFLVAFIQKATSEQMNFDQLFLVCVKLIAAFYLIENGLEIFEKILSFGNGLMSDFTALYKPGGDPEMEIAKNEIWKDLTGKSEYPDYPGIGRGLLAMGQLLLPWILTGVLSGVGTFIAYSRTIEILLRICVAPIALSDFMTEGLHGAGWRYIKTFLAICMQGFIILLIVKIYTLIAADIVIGGSFMDAIVKQSVIAISAIALMFKSLSFCKELVGVH